MPILAAADTEGHQGRCRTWLGTTNIHLYNTKPRDFLRIPTDMCNNSAVNENTEKAIVHCLPAGPYILLVCPTDEFDQAFVCTAKSLINYERPLISFKVTPIYTGVPL